MAKNRKDIENDILIEERIGEEEDYEEYARLREEREGIRARRSRIEEEMSGGRTQSSSGQERGKRRKLAPEKKKRNGAVTRRERKRSILCGLSSLRSLL